MEDYKKGDIVELTAGGPKMVVSAAFGDGTFRCQWFAGKKLESGVFSRETLKRCPADSAPEKSK